MDHDCTEGEKYRGKFSLPHQLAIKQWNSSWCYKGPIKDCLSCGQPKFLHEVNALGLWHKPWHELLLLDEAFARGTYRIGWVRRWSTYEHCFERWSSPGFPLCGLSRSWESYPGLPWPCARIYAGPSQRETRYQLWLCFCSSPVHHPGFLVQKSPRIERMGGEACLVVQEKPRYAHSTVRARGCLKGYLPKSTGRIQDWGWDFDLRLWRWNRGESLPLMVYHDVSLPAIWAWSMDGDSTETK